MSLIYITGNSGAGKSSVRNELQKRGYEAHDTDEGGITSWRHKVTDEAVIRPTDTKDRTKEWYEEHDWKMSRPKVQELASKAKNKTIFLCGSTSNAGEMLDLFGKIIFLEINKDTLRTRLINRTDNDFGKAPDELDNILGWHKSFEDEYRLYGATMVDAARPLSVVVDNIVEAIR